MTKQQFIEEVAKYVKKYAPKYNIKVYSPIIAQFCLESGYGTSNKVKKILVDGTVDWRHNYAGLKWRNNRCAISNDYFEEGTSEQNKDGSYVGIVSKFFRFKSLEDCVIGYFQFTNISFYANLKGVTDPEQYLKNIKADKYATSIDYVQKNMNVIKQWNLTKYDPINQTSQGENKMAYKAAIDAGHGSNTAGKRTPDGWREHWTNVKCANYFDIALKRCGINTVKVGFDDTNSKDDTDVALSKRQSQIKNAKCDISVSWHANAFGNGKTYNSGQGIETLIHKNHIKAKDSESLAIKVQNYLIKGTQQENREVKSANLAMCNCVAMGTKASILIEVGFMTNEREAELIQSDAFCSECAEEATQGVCEYFGVTYVKPNGQSVSTPPQTIPPKPISTVSTYTVIKGDTLSKIGKKTGVAWKTIAQLNGIKSPYSIKVGQVLKLTASTNSSTNATSTQSVIKTKVIYISHCIGNDNWCSEITGYNMNNSNGYSGIIGKPIDKFTIKLSQGTITYVAHKKGGSWFGEVSGYSTTKSNAYAGATGKEIDAIAIKASGIIGTLKYRVHTKDDNKWLGWITGYSKTDSSKYAGIFGKEIDAIQIGIE